MTNLARHCTCGTPGCVHVGAEEAQRSREDKLMQMGYSTTTTGIKARTVAFRCIMFETDYQNTQECVIISD